MAIAYLFLLVSKRSVFDRDKDKHLYFMILDSGGTREPPAASQRDINTTFILY